MNTPILICADSSLSYEVQTDDSETGIGAVLQQKDENGSRPVANMSRKLNAAEQNYKVHERELLAIVCALQEFRARLLGNKSSKSRSQIIAIFTNSSALVSPSGALGSFRPGFSL
jgi:ribose 1,5-bisphosphokinase PhnN